MNETDMGKYFIIPAEKAAVEIAAGSPEEALAEFVSRITSDTGKYFRAVTEDEYHRYSLAKQVDEEKAALREFYWNELNDCFSDSIPEEDFDRCTEAAYKIYTNVEGLTEYEALEQAVDEYLENKEKAEGGQ